jgi:hypothetical protein
LLASAPNEILATYFTLLEKSSDGRENVLVLTDVFSKCTVAIPTRNHTTTTTGKAIMYGWFMKTIVFDILKHASPIESCSDQINSPFYTLMSCLRMKHRQLLFLECPWQN